MNYSSKVISAADAVKLVKSGDHIVTGLGGSEARDFLSELHTIAKDVKDVTVTNCLPMTDFEFMHGEYADVFNVDGWFYNPSMRKVHKQGNAAFIPNHLHLAAIKRLKHVKPTFYVGSSSAVDRHGYVSLSLGNTYEKRMLEAADVVILEANPNFPRTFGDISVHISEIDYIIESDYMPPVLPSGEPSENDMKIGEFISEYIEDGSCIQLGIGGIPNAVASMLYDKKDLGVHTEMITSEMAKLAKAGVITGKFKTLHKGQMVGTLILGDEELYDYIDDNPSIMIMDGNYVNDPKVIAQNDKQISINTALEVDLTGQVCSESIGSMQFSGTGGQADTAIGAQDSKDGKSFIALYSTAMVRNKETGEKERKSKIVTQLEKGAAVSLSRNDVDYVVTEYGVASLRGTNIKERVKRLIAIAHPDYREELYREALAAKIIVERK